MAVGKDDVIIRIGLHLKKYNKGLRLLKYGTLAALAATGASAIYAVRKFQEFEQALAGVQKVADFSAKELGQFKQQIDQLSKTIPVSKTALYETAEAAAVLGIRGAKNLTKFSETMGRMAVATDLSGEDAAKAIARIIQLSGEAPGSIDKFGSALVELGNNFKASEAEIVANATRIRQSTAAYEISSTEILAIATATKEAGIQAELAGTAVGRTIRAMDNSIAEGGKKLAALEEIMGMTGDKINEVFRDSPAKAFKIFVDGLKTTERPTAESGRLLRSMGLQGERLMSVLPSLAKNSDRLGEAFETSNKAYRENNALVKESNAFFETSAQKQKLLKNKIDSLADTVGKQLVPFWNELIDLTGQWVDFINQPENLAAIENFAQALGMVASNFSDWMMYFAKGDTPEEKLQKIYVEMKRIDMQLEKRTLRERARMMLLTQKNKLLKEAESLEKQLANTKEQSTKTEKNAVKELKKETAKRSPSATGPKPDTGPIPTDKKDEAKGMTWEEELEEFRLRNEQLNDIEDKRNAKTIVQLRKLEKQKEKLSKEERKRLEEDLKLADTVEKQKMAMSLRTATTSFGHVTTMLENIQTLTKNKSKEMFYIIRAARIAETIMNTASGIMNAFATMPTPAAFVAAGAIGTTGAVQLATIMDQRPPGMRKGGVVKREAGTPSTGDHQLAYLEPGELVTPKESKDDVVEMEAIRKGYKNLDENDEDNNRMGGHITLGLEDDLADFVFIKRRMNSSLNIGVT